MNSKIAAPSRKTPLPGGGLATGEIVRCSKCQYLLVGLSRIECDASHIGSLPLACLENWEQLRRAQLCRWVSGFVRRALHAKAQSRDSRPGLMKKVSRETFLESF